MVPRRGFEPRLATPKAAVLPLNERGLARAARFELAFTVLETVALDQTKLHRRNGGIATYLDGLSPRQSEVVNHGILVASQAQNVNVILAIRTDLCILAGTRAYNRYRLSSVNMVLK